MSWINTITDPLNSLRRHTAAKWRERRMIEEISSLPFHVRKDIGWPDIWEQRRGSRH